MSAKTPPTAAQLAALDAHLSYANVAMLKALDFTHAHFSREDSLALQAAHEAVARCQYRVIQMRKGAIC